MPHTAPYWTLRYAGDSAADRDPGEAGGDERQERGVECLCVVGHMAAPGVEPGSPANEAGDLPFVLAAASYSCGANGSATGGPVGSYSLICSSSRVTRSSSQSG